jgi:organic hydroperoxide reductase OsmC/OhrA
MSESKTTEHKIEISWKKGSNPFQYETYDRTHAIRFQGGQSIFSSATPEYFGKAEHTNPEELLASALASCHMLTFLAVAAKKKYTLVSYESESIAVLEKSESGKAVVSKIRLIPRVQFEGEKVPDSGELAKLHETAHKNCIIANSIQSKVEVESPA